MFLVAIVFGFMMPGMIQIDDGGKNHYTVYLNESKIGATDSRDTIDEVFVRGVQLGGKGSGFARSCIGADR